VDAIAAQFGKIDVLINVSKPSFRMTYLYRACQRRMHDEEAAIYWLDVLQHNARRWRPLFGSSRDAPSGAGCPPVG